MKVLFEPVLLPFPSPVSPACRPRAVLLIPVVLLMRANAPLAVLFPPVVLLFRDWKPMAVLLAPSLLKRAFWQTVVLLLPDMFDNSGLTPLAVVVFQGVFEV